MDRSAGAGPGGDGRGVVVVAHGGGAEWNRPVLEVVDAVELPWPVEAAFLFGAEGASVAGAVARLRARQVERVVAVPLFVSSHSSHSTMVAGAVRESARGCCVEVTRALDRSPELAAALIDRALALVESPAGHPIHLVGHGPNAEEDYRRWMEELEPVAEMVRRDGGFVDVRVGLVRDDAADAVRSAAVTAIRASIEEQNRETGQPVVVVPVLVSTGFLSTRRLPEDLAGLPIRYDPAGLAPHPALARWVERRVREATS